MFNLESLGLIGLMFLIILVAFIPLFATIIVGVALANMLGFVSITWWAFVILFYLLISAIFAALAK